MITKYLCTLELRQIKNRALNWLLVPALFIFEIAAQTPRVKDSPTHAGGVNVWSFLVLFVLFSVLAVFLIWMFRSRSGGSAILARDDRKTPLPEKSLRSEAIVSAKESESLTGDQEPLEKSRRKNRAEQTPPAANELNPPSSSRDRLFKDSEADFKQNLENLQNPDLAIFKIKQLDLARPFSPLDVSVDPALLTAIEQTQDEFEEDTEVRDLAVRILAAFKTRNAVEALSQVALYDLSSQLRVKAINVLADFDHESVFETILLACADPTREVRAAAARGLFRLSFDRADAWKRIAETNDIYRMRQAVCAATEAELVSRSFERLIHTEHKIVYEAVTLLALMIRADQTAQIFDCLKNHRDENVKLAVLRVFELTEDERFAPLLGELLENSDLSDAAKKRIDRIIKRFELIPA